MSLQVNTSVSQAHQWDMNNAAANGSAVPANAPASAAEKSALLDPNAAFKAEAQQLIKQQFSDLAGDASRFHANMQRVFGDGYDRNLAEQFRKQAQAGDFSWLPPIRLVDDAALNGAPGAYDNQASVVYLNRSLLNDPAQAATVYMHEVGHHLDNKLNKTDTLGEEGELFQRVMSGEKLTAAQEAEIRTRESQGTAQIGGQNVNVEYWGAFKKIAKGIGNAFKSVGKAVSGVVGGIKDAVGGVVGGIKNTIGGAVDGIKKSVGGVIDRVKEGAGKVFKGIKKGFSKIGKGIKGFLQKNMKWIGPVLDVVSLAVNVIPGIGQAASVAIAMGSQALKTAATVAATGKLYAQQLVGLATSFLPGVSKFLGMGSLSAAQTALASGALKAGAEYIDTGKVSASTVVGALGPSVFGNIPGGAKINDAFQKGATLVAKAIDNRKLDLSDAASLLSTVAGTVKGGANATAINNILGQLNVDPNTFDLMKTAGNVVAGLVQNGKLQAQDVARLLQPMVGRVSDDPNTQKMLTDTLSTLAKLVDTKQLNANALVNLAADYLRPMLDQQVAAAKAWADAELQRIMGAKQAA